MAFGLHLGVSQTISNAEEIVKEFSKGNKELNETIRIDVSGLSLYDFLNSIAIEHKINISADSELDYLVESSFFDISVKDVFLFVIKKYKLDVEIISDIIVFKKKTEKKVQVKLPVEKNIDVSFNKHNGFLSVKLTNDLLFKVAQKITDVSGRNIVLSQDIKGAEISSYIVSRPFNQVLEMIAKSNGLKVTKDDNDFYFIEKDNFPKKILSKSKKNSKKEGRKKPKGADAEIELTDNGFINIRAYESSVHEIIIEIADMLDVKYFMYKEPREMKTTLVGANMTFEELLYHMFKESAFTFKNIDGFYLIGDQNGKGLRSTELIQLEDRAVESIMETLPPNLLSNIEVKEVLELNGLMVSGSRPRIEELKAYIKEIDKVVPMILIEVIIVQYQKSHDTQTGIKTGLSKELKETTTGVLFPTADVSMNSSSINKLIEAFNGLGIFNLGKVTERFYLDLKFLENNSIINLQSTPKISTLNGHEAKLSIGETNYYFEQNNRLINSGIGNDILQSGQWKPTEANLSLNIKPVVSKGEQITLSITVEKSSFLGRSGDNAPPGKATQQFESLIRVKNNEMILLGGLDELEKENSGTGTPIVSRIPILKWFFSGRIKRKKKAKLHVFIKPSVVY